MGQNPATNPGMLVCLSDTTFGKYHGHSLDSGYLQLPTDNGILLHHGLLTDEQFVPLGLPIQLITQRDRAEYGKRVARKNKPFADKESAKWLTAIDWSRRFSRQTGGTLVQVCDRTDFYGSCKG